MGKFGGGIMLYFKIIDGVPSPVVKPTPTVKPTLSPSVSPIPTQKPSPSVIPDPTVIPKPSVSPTPSDIPKPSVNPDPTEASDPTEAPGPSEAPDPTETPKPSEVPEPTETPKPTVEPDAPKDLSIENVQVMTYTGGKITQNLKVYWGDILLKEGTEYTVAYKNNVNVGTATITVTGKGNYVGKVTEDFEIKKADVADAAVIVNAANETGKALKPKVTVSYYGKNLALNKDYQVEVDWNNPVVTDQDGVRIKTYPVTVRGIGKNFEGTNTKAVFKVYPKGKKAVTDSNYIDLKKGSIKLNRANYTYTGNEIIPDFSVYTLKGAKGDIIDPSRYTVSYTSNTNKGNATITVTGIESQGVMGTTSLKFAIQAKNISDRDINITMPDNEDILYAKGGVKPEPVITFTDTQGNKRTLREGVDYTLAYANNKVVGAGGNKAPKITVKGTGNFAGSVTRTFAIGKQDIGNTNVIVTDKAVNAKKKGTYFISPVKVYDLDGKLLAAKTDYNVRYFNDADGREIDKNTVIAGTGRIKVVVSGTKNYIGEKVAYYQVRVLKDLSKVKADKITDQQYTGRAVRADNELHLYVMNGTSKAYLAYGTDYEIVGCYNNVKKGTATYILRGKGDYSGTKSVTFRISQAKFKKRNK